MTIDVNDLRAQLRAAADQAARRAKEYRAEGNVEDAEFYSGRQAGFVGAIGMLLAVEDAAARERDANILDEQIGEEAARLGLIGYGQGVDLGAVERLEEFARNAGGAVDMASGTVYSDADGGL